MTAARADILAAIRAARPLHEPAVPDRVAYRDTLDLPPAALAERLAMRLTDYGVTVLRIPTAATIAATAAGQFQHRALVRVVVPADLPADWRPAGTIPDIGLSYADLNDADGAMTGCRIAIAESGTIVLDGGKLSGRRALTLLPDYHLCVVLTDQIVGLLPEAMPSLAQVLASGSAASGPLTFFSGPSATADIELDRVQGVHGPRTLDVILVG
jgi:L-lactate dehydrogenase complex protein LldG